MKKIHITIFLFLWCFAQVAEAQTSQKVILEDYGVFVCEGFEGDIHFIVYDIVGKVQHEGFTRNGEHNSYKVSNGIYLLKIEDTSGNMLVKKVVLG